eukprot:scaffold10272_cov124-Isochrysis_galbana.AAC.2
MERWNRVLVLRGFWLQGGHWVHPGCADGQPQLNVRGVRDGQRTSAEAASGRGTGRGLSVSAGQQAGGRRLTYFWFSMEQLPADARAAPSASGPNDIVMDIASSPKRPRDPAQDNKVSQRATPFDPAMLEIHKEPARACQSLAHHTTLTGRCPKSVDTWAPLCEEPQSRSTTSYVAERLRKQGNSAILVLAAVLHCSHSQTTPERESTRVSDITCSKEQTPPPTTPSFSADAEKTPPLTALGALSEGQRQTAHLPPSPTYVTHQKTHKLTPLHPHPSQKGKGKAPPLRDCADNVSPRVQKICYREASSPVSLSGKEASG